MKTIISCLCALLVFATSSPSTVSANGLHALMEMEDAFVSIAERLKPTVVAISPLPADKRPSPKKDNKDKKKKFHDDNNYTGSGSGIILSKDGLIITNNHVVGKQKYLEVKLDNQKKFVASVVGQDKDTDIAVIKIDPGDIKLVPATFADSNKVKIGQLVVAIGHPFGLEMTVTFGNVTGLGREDINLSRYENFIQTDASINPGNSGGPLFNIRGEIIGINTAILNYAQGVGFAIPSNMAKSISSHLVTDGKVMRGWLGVGIQLLTDDIASKIGLEEPAGVLINETFKGNPAAEAGLLPGDIILSVNNNKLHTPATLSRMIAETQPDESVLLGIFRDGKEIAVKVVLSQRSTDYNARIDAKLHKEKTIDIPGVVLKNLTAELIETYGFETDKGVLVDSIEKESAAGYSGLKKDDIIIEVEKQNVANLKDLEAILAVAEKDSKLLVRILRSGRALYLLF